MNPKDRLIVALDFDATVNSVSPEVSVTPVGDHAKVITDGTEQTVTPLTMSGKWPEMANCLLSRLSGKISSSTGSEAVIETGSG